MLGFSSLASAPLGDDGPIVLSRSASIVSASNVAAVASLKALRSASIVSASNVDATASLKALRSASIVSVFGFCHC